MASLHCTVHGCRRFSFERAQHAAGWQQELLGGQQHQPESLEYGIGSFVYRATRPMNAERLWEFMTSSRSLLVSCGAGRVELSCSVNAAHWQPCTGCCFGQCRPLF